MALKDSYTSSLETKLAVELATLIFNKSFFSTLSELCKTLEFHVSERMNKQWKAIDSEGKMKKTLQNRHQIKEQQKKKKKKNKNKKKKKKMLFLKQGGNVEHFMDLVIWNKCLHKIGIWKIKKSKKTWLCFKTILKIFRCYI